MSKLVVLLIALSLQVLVPAVSARTLTYEVEETMELMTSCLGAKYAKNGGLFKPHAAIAAIEGWASFEAECSRYAKNLTVDDPEGTSRKFCAAQDSDQECSEAATAAGYCPVDPAPAPDACETYLVERWEATMSSYKTRGGATQAEGQRAKPGKGNGPP